MLAHHKYPNRPGERGGPGADVIAANRTALRDAMAGRVLETTANQLDRITENGAQGHFRVHARSVLVYPYTLTVHDREFVADDKEYNAYEYSAHRARLFSMALPHAAPRCDATPHPAHTHIGYGAFAAHREPRGADADAGRRDGGRTLTDIGSATS